MKQIKAQERREKLMKEKNQKLHKLRNSQGRLLLAAQGEPRVIGFKVGKREKVKIPRLEAKRMKKSEKHFSKWKSKGKERTIDF